MKYYVVTDVHGFYSELKTALKEKGYYDDAEPHKLIVCGDLLDRGEEVRGTVEFVLDLMARDEVILVRGNHEDLMLKFLDTVQEVMPKYERTAHWHNGTIDTALKIAGMTLFEAQRAPERLAELVRKSDFIQKIIPATKDYFETKNHVFVHGWIPCDTVGMRSRATEFFYREDWRDMGAEAWSDARWYNGMEAHHQGVVVPGKTVVCGHIGCGYGNSKYGGAHGDYEDSWNSCPYVKEGIVALDASTAGTGIVNCVVIEDEPLED